MSDFLSNFDKDNYAKTKDQKQTPEEGPTRKRVIDESELADDEPVVATPAPQPRSARARKKAVPKRPTRFAEEETETDLGYKKKQRNKYLKIAGVVVVALAVLGVAYYKTTRVTLPNLVGKELAEARSWAAENGVKLNIAQEYDFASEPNIIVSQSVKKGQALKKGSELKLTASLGADPEEGLPLPDFATMTKVATQEWIEQNKAENAAVIEEYSDTVEQNGFLRVELTSKDITNETYRRKDRVKIYYSKGKETFEKNISVPDFSGKPKAEVEAWAKTNEIQLTYEESDSETVPIDSVISQSIAKDEKIAKREAMTVVLSVGKAIIVPNFAEFTPEEAGTAVEGLAVQAKSVFSSAVPYGGLLSQSVEAGTKLTAKDDPTVKVVYSSGQPYLKDLRGATLEGDLQRIFYEEYRSKGANITYTIQYVDSAETKGSVVGMSVYNEYVPLDYVVTISISKGNLAQTATPPAAEPEDSDDTPQTEE